MIYTWWAQRQASASLQASEALYAGIFNHSAESIFLLDVLPDGKLVWETANAAWEEGMGIPAAAIAGKSLLEVLPPEMAASLENRCRACIAGSGPIVYEQTLELRGSTRMWRIILVPIWDTRGRIVKLQGSARDVTEEKRAIAEQLRQTRYRHLLTSIVLKIRSSLDLENILATTVLEVQKTLQAERVFFYLLSPDGSGKLVHQEQTPGLSPIAAADLEGCWPSEDIEKYCCSGAYAITEISQAEFSRPHLEFLHRHEVRSQMTVPVFVRPLAQETEEEPAILLWGLLCVQQRHRREWSHWEVDLMKELADQLSIALYQAQLLEQETRQSQDLARSNAELEQFAYIASHDLQEPLRTVGSFAQLLERRYQDKLEEKALRYIKFIVDGTTRMQTLVNDLLEYSRVGTRGKPFQMTDCNAVLDEAIANLEGTIRKSGATVQGWRYGDSDITGGHYRRPKAVSGLPVVMADSGQLVQLFQNLIGNAIKYSRPDESPLVNVTAQRQEEEWRFRIQDNGIGIDPKHFDRIFQIFQRLHAQDEYSGTGIGLAICQKIIQRHGGRIWVESKPGFGSSFYFTIPDRNISTP
ncbi:MAG TPA: GAF domain-containing protein [Oscillatoriaceae cyanobacterium M33_DOE_052]|nr:GAF domain-containing protein [Oscillatoriaceae cyanobacterium M33_DOE_052]